MFLTLVSSFFWVGVSFGSDWRRERESIISVRWFLKLREKKRKTLVSSLAKLTVIF